jgi:hypothetical protein
VTDEKDKGTGAEEAGATTVAVPEAELEQLKAAKDFQDKVTEELDKKEEPKETPKEPDKKEGLSDADQEKIKQSGMQSAQAQLTSNWTEFMVEQLSATEKSPFTKDDLFKVIQKQSALVGATARNFNGNVFAAANHILTVTDPDAVAKARKSTEDAEAAKKRAAGSTDLPDGKTASPKETTPEEKLEKELQKERDSIYADDAPVIP